MSDILLIMSVNKFIRLFIACTFLFLSLNLKAQFTTIGDASGPDADGWYQLTPDANWSQGYVWNQLPFNLNQPLVVEGKLNFGIYDGTGADGICFVIQNQCAGASVDGGGGNIGYKDFPGQSIAVEFDTYQNADPVDPLYNYDDPAGDHISVITFGNLNHTFDGNTSPSGTIDGPVEIGNIEDGMDHTFRITYDPVNYNLQVFFDGTLHVNLENYNIVQEIFNGSPYVYWGFTSSTGGSRNLQKVFIENTPTNLNDVTICTTPGNIEVHLPSLSSFEGKNIALTKASVASSVNGGNMSQFAFDGSTTSKWESVWNIEEQWIYVDLGDEYNLDSVQIFWEHSAAATYDIQTAPAGSDPMVNASWTTASSNYTRVNVGPAPDYKDVITFSSTSTRYVRMLGHTRQNGYGYSIYEMAVYGKPTSGYVWTASPPSEYGTITNPNSPDPTFAPVITTTYSVVIADPCLPPSNASFTVTVDCPTPLTFLDFTVKRTHDIHQLYWVTTNEVNTSHFIIEKSEGNGAFYPIGNVGSANTPGVHSYSFNDQTYMQGISYYRIVQYDLDGKFDSSLIRSVSSVQTNLFVSPNPGNGLFTLKGYSDSEEEYDITIMNAIGQAVLNKKVFFTSNFIEINLDISEFAPGTYILHATTPHKKEVIKIIKK